MESFTEALEMFNKGANRIELCENLAVGGTTPSFGTIKQAISLIPIPIFVMIRPRGGNFIYSDEEISIMKEDIILCKNLGIKGIVLGVLNIDNTINYSLLKELVTLASPMEVTFHKAIDEVKNPLNEIPFLKEIGIKRILTSGKSETALEGKDLINSLITISYPEITIVAAGKITSNNFSSVIKEIHAFEFHGKKIVS